MFELCLNHIGDLPQILASRVISNRTTYCGCSSLSPSARITVGVYCIGELVLGLREAIQLFWLLEWNFVPSVSLDFCGRDKAVRGSYVASCHCCSHWLCGHGERSFRESYQGFYSCQLSPGLSRSVAKGGGRVRENGECIDDSRMGSYLSVNKCLVQERK